MNGFIVSLVGGAALGGTYALIGLGLVLAFRATATFNFAHGQLMLLPTFMVAKWQADKTVSFGVGLIISLLVVIGVAVGFYFLVLQKMTGLPHFMGIIATLGLASILDGVMTLEYGSQDYILKVPGLPTGITTIFGSRFTTASIVLTVATLVVAAAVAGLLRFTQFGTQVRAAGQDPILASQGGIPVRRLYAVSWGAAALLAALAGFAYGAANVVGPSMVNLALLAFPAILLGGLDSIEGAVLGGILVGVMQGFIVTYWGGAVVDVITYLLLLVILLVRPNGLLGTAAVTRV